MKKRGQWLFIFMVVSMIMIIPEHSYAMYGDTASLPWSAPLVKLKNELGGPIAKMMAAVTVVMTGVMLMFGRTGGMAKKGIQLVFGMSIALSAINSDGIIAKIFVGDYTLSATATSATPPAIGSEQFLDHFMDFLVKQCLFGASQVHAYVFQLLILLGTIDFVMNLIFKFEKQDPIPMVLKETMRFGFFMFLLQDWMIGGIIFDSGGIVSVIFSSFAQLGLIAGGNADAGVSMATVMSKFSVSQISDAVKLLASNSLVTATSMNLNSIGTLLVTLLCVVGIILAGFFMAIEIFLAVIEFWIISLVSMPLIGFGLLVHTKFLFEKVIGALFAQGVKIMVVMFIYAFSRKMFVDAAGAVVLDGKVNLSSLIDVLLSVLTVFVLVKKVPDLAQGLLSGSPSLGGVSATSAIREGFQDIVGTKNPLTQEREGGIIGYTKAAGSVAAGAAAGTASGIAAATGGGRALLNGVAGRGIAHGVKRLATNTAHMGLGAGKGLYDSAKGKVVGGVKSAGESLSNSYNAGYVKTNDARIAGEKITSAVAQNIKTPSAPEEKK